MTSALQNLLNRYRESAKTEREKGEYFELLAKDYLKNDPIQKGQFEDVWTYSEWAKATGKDILAKKKNSTSFVTLKVLQELNLREGGRKLHPTNIMIGFLNEMIALIN